MQLLTAQVVKPARVVDTKFGQRFVLDIDINGQTEAIWGPSNKVPTAQYGQTINVGRDSKGKLHLIESAPVIDNGKALAPTQPQGMTPETKKAIAQYVQDQRDLLAFCLDQAATIPQAQTDESVEKLGVTLYLSAQRKFKLA